MYAIKHGELRKQSPSVELSQPKILIILFTDAVIVVVSSPHQSPRCGV